jgi:hypothetical protein
VNAVIRDRIKGFRDLSTRVKDSKGGGQKVEALLKRERSKE